MNTLSCLSERSPAALSFSCLQPFHTSRCNLTSSKISLLLWGAASQGSNSVLGARAEPVLEVLSFFIAGRMLLSALSAMPGQLFRDAIPQSIAGE